MSINSHEFCPNCNRHLANVYGTILYKCRACGWHKFKPGRCV